MESVTLLSAKAQNSYLSVLPVVTVVEAKNEILKSGFGQRIAEMIVTQIFNNCEGNQIA